MSLRRLALLASCAAIVSLGLRSWLAPSTVRRADTPSAVQPGHDLIPEANLRPTVFTYLTIPEWYLVWSSDEYADFIANRPPSDFPYLGHLGQFWSGYRTVFDSTNDRYEFNSGYHLMIGVIGVSTSAEYGIKAAYEHIVGRLTEASRFSGMTAEDSLAAVTARRYVEFIRVEPWYRFDFLTPLRKLWTEAGLWGGDPLRKWERKYFLTSEYAAKAAYGWLLMQSAGAVYGEEKMVTAVVMDRAPEHPADSIPEFTLLARNRDGSILATVPRYQAFTRYAEVLAKSGLNFLNIAGNSDVILVSVIVPDGFDTAGLSILMRQPIMTRPGLQRLVITVPVRSLADMIRQWEGTTLSIEHVYDY